MEKKSAIKKSAITELGISTAAAAGSGVLGGLINQLFAGSNDRRQIRQQQKLTDMQVAANKEMADYEQELGLQMWKETNYPAQVEMMNRKTQSEEQGKIKEKNLRERFSKARGIL